MAYDSLAEIVQVLSQEGELKPISHPVKTEPEITEIADRVIRRFRFS